MLTIHPGLVRRYYGSLAAGQDPEFHLTKTFCRPYGDAEAIEAFRFFTKAVQRRIPSRRFLRGMAFGERTWKSAAFEGCLHFHSLLWGIKGNVSQPFEYLSHLANSVSFRLRDRRGRPMCQADSVLVQEIDDPDGAVQYVLKDVEHFNFDRRTQMWLIDRNGLRYELPEGNP